MGISGWGVVRGHGDTPSPEGNVMKFRVDLTKNHGWMNIGDIAGDGTHTYIKFTKEHGMIVKKIIPAAVFQEIEKDITYQRELNYKGSLLRNTQGHWLPIASMPSSIHAQWKQELGDYKKDATALKKWKARWNSNEYKDFRTSEHHV